MGPCREHVRVLGSDALGARASGPHRAEGPQGADRSDTPEPATPPPEAWPRERCPGSAGLWPASGRRPARRRQERHARASHTPAQGTAQGAMPRERGPLARIGPKARKAPTGATRPSQPPPRPRHGPGSDGVSRKRRRPVRLPMWRACGPLRAGRPRSQGRHPSVTRRPCAAGPFQALSEEVDGSVSGTCSCTWERCPVSAGIMPAPGRRPAKRRQERHARAGHTPARGVALGAMGSPGSAGVPSACPCGGPVARCGRDARAPRDGTRASLADPAPQGNSKLSARRLMGPCREHVRVLGSDALGARASGPHRAEGPQGADKNDTPEPATPPPEAWPWERWGLPEAQASRPLAHVAGLRPACGRDARAPRDGARASLADPAPQGHSKLSARRLMGPCREHVRVLGSDALGARASGPHRAEGPQSADKNDTPEPPTPPPEAWPRE